MSDLHYITLLCVVILLLEPHPAQDFFSFPILGEIIKHFLLDTAVKLFKKRLGEWWKKLPLKIQITLTFRVGGKKKRAHGATRPRQGKPKQTQGRGR